MKKTLLLIIAIICSIAMYAQENPQYSHFLFNKLAYNPGYTGGREVLAVQALYRQQWQNIEGAPQTANIAIHSPFANRTGGIGLMITQDEIGLLSNTAVDALYAYRLHLGKSTTLSLGIQARFEYSKINWSKGKTTGGTDNLVPADNETTVKPNFGAGAYLTSGKFFIGFSVPQLMETTLYRDNLDKLPSFKRFRTYYLMTGVEIPLSSSVDFMPGMLVSYNPNAPLEAEWNLNLIFSKTLLIGASYRAGDSVDALLGVQLSKQLRMGLSYDYSLSELKKYNVGSFEAMLEYCFNYNDTGIRNLRYF
ncbi:MAG TPA: type IX secretion system membrane protein PorP/SprF [Saprospiraceae bacterium]|nr:type IX secretion system membrane protein PorP/SprF [Saprospiraceae bacterium]